MDWIFLRPDDTDYLVYQVFEDEWIAATRAHGTAICKSGQGKECWKCEDLYNDPDYVAKLLIHIL